MTFLIIGIIILFLLLIILPLSFKVVSEYERGVISD